jgi:hypothetical protein
MKTTVHQRDTHLCRSRAFWRPGPSALASGGHWTKEAVGWPTAGRLNKAWTDADDPAVFRTGRLESPRRAAHHLGSVRAVPSISRHGGGVGSLPGPSAKTWNSWSSSTATTGEADGRTRSWSPRPHLLDRGPSSMKVLRHQRHRWYRGLWETLWSRSDDRAIVPATGRSARRSLRRSGCERLRSPGRRGGSRGVSRWPGPTAPAVRR